MNQQIKFCSLVLPFLLSFISIYAQDNSVTIGGTNINNNAVLTLIPNGGQGLILPVLSSSTRNGMSLGSADKGMIVFDSGDNLVYFWTGATWISTSSSGGGGGNYTLSVVGNSINLLDGASIVSSVQISQNTPSTEDFLTWDGTQWIGSSLNVDNSTIIGNGVSTPLEIKGSGVGNRGILASDNDVVSWVNGANNQFLGTNASGTLGFYNTSILTDATSQSGILIGNGTSTTGVTPTNDVIFRGNGTTLVASGLTDDGSTITTDGRTIEIKPTAAPGTTTNKLYNVSGTLFWDGTDLTAGGGGADGLSLTGNDLSLLDGASTLSTVQLSSNTPVTDHLLQWDGAKWASALLNVDNTTISGNGVTSPLELISAGAGNRGILGSDNDVIAWVSGANSQFLGINASGTLGFYNYSSIADLTTNTGILIGNGTATTGVTPTNNVIFKGDGTTLVASGITDDGASITTTGRALEMEAIAAPATTTNKLYNVAGTLFWDGTDLTAGGGGFWSQNGSDLFYTTGNVGIGVNPPTEALDVAGNINISTGSVLKVNGATFLSNIGSNSTFVGVNAGAANTGNNNTFIGNDAGKSNTSGGENVFIGHLNGDANTTGSYNVIIGRSAGGQNVDGGLNTIIGFNAGSSNVTGDGNTFVGGTAGRSNTGDLNTFVGEKSGELTTTGDANTFVGREAGNTNTTGFSNTIIGEGADVASSNLNNATAIGADAIVGQSNTIMLGKSGTLVGVGYATPTQEVEIYGTSGTSTNPSTGMFYKATNTANGPSFPCALPCISPTVGIDFNLEGTYSTSFPVPGTFELDDWRVANTNGILYIYSSDDGFNSTTSRFLFDETVFRPATNATTDLGSSAARFNDIYLVNNPDISSDRRLKTDIVPLSPGLKEILQLAPVQYHLKSDTKKENYEFGLIAQDTKIVLPEIVNKNPQSEYLSITYAELIPVLVKAIQEQQKIIEQLNQKVSNFNNSDVASLRAELQTLKADIQMLKEVLLIKAEKND